MRKIQTLLLAAAMLVISLAAQAQAKMTIELKNGTNLSFYTSEINKMSWTEGTDTPTGGENDPGEQTVTGDATDVTSFSAKVTCYANNILDNESTDLEVGIIYTDNGTPSKSNGTQMTVSKSSIGIDGKYTVSLTSLKENTTYQYRSFVYQSGIYFLGAVKSFTTKPQQAAVSFNTGDATNVNCYSAKVSAQMLVESSSVYSKLSYGICYGTTAEPATKQQVTSKDATGTYTTTLKGLAGNTIYYYRPYADMDGTMHYGPVSSFKTSEDNVVETGEADKAGNVTSKLTIGGGAYSKLELGVCFSTSNPEPTVSDNTRTTSEVDDDNCYVLNVLNVLKEFGTTYYRSYVRIDGTAHYGAVKQITINMPTLATSGAVDLGLSVKWAACNIDASSPGDYGGYYAWGEIEEKSNYSWSTYFDSVDGSDSNFKKYAIGKKTQLDPEDDVAHVKLGGDWRMPTKAEQDELRKKCAWIWTTYGNHKGYVVIGSTGDALFLPAAGYRNDSGLHFVGSDGRYWSSSLVSDYSSSAYYLVFDSSSAYVDWSYDDRNCGRSVRAVCP